MNILILEDEEPAARQLRQQLAELGYAPSPPPVLRSIEKALVWLQTHPLPDLILSDIELLDGTVFALYEQFPVACPIIFTTAYDQYLLAAFRGNGIAYLLKPFTTEGLGAALGSTSSCAPASPRRRKTAPASAPTCSAPSPRPCIKPHRPRTNNALRCGCATACTCCKPPT